MKKSIFLFFAAILCATNAWGAKLFFDHSSVNYPADGALVAIWSWGGSSSDAWSVFKASGADNIIVADIADGRTGGKIVRFKSSVTTPDWNDANAWNKTGDISFPSGKNCIKITAWDNATSGTWSEFQLESQASITPSASSVSVGEEVTFTPALTSNQEYNDVLSTTYSVGAGATITDGKFVATEAGTYTVTATVTYNAQGYTNITKTATATCSITVSAVAVPHPVTGVTVAPTSVTIKQGATATLTATVSPSNADDPSITWSSDNTSVATVVNGVVTAVAAGTANITVTTVDGGFTATCAVKVKPSQYTFHAINSAQWPTVAAHYWGGADGGSSWPGADMVKESETINGFDIYSITISSDFTNIMFTNKIDGDNNKKTADLTTEGNDGKYYDIKGAKWYASLAEVPAPDPLATDVFLAGSMNGWSTTANEFKKVEEGSATATLTMNLEAETEYEFKVMREGAWTSSKDNRDIKGSVSELVFSSSTTDNTKMTTTVAGDYVFTWNDSKLSITYPASTEPDPTPDPADVTVYFVNTKSWSTVNAYVWGAAEYKGWPGEAMTPTGENAHGYDVYSYTFPAEYTNCIFNGNGKTDDLTVEAGQYFDIASKTWYATLADVPNPAPAVMETVYFINTSNWGKVNAYAWTSSGDNEWPGAEMTPEAEQIAGVDVYSFTAEQGQWANLIFNNGEGTQTGDLKWEAGKYYMYSKNAWYDTKEDAEDALAGPATIVLHGNFLGGWADTEAFTLSADQKTATLTTLVKAGDHEFGVRLNNVWTANGKAFTKTDNEHVIEAGSSNLTLNAEITGDYVFTWTYETNTLTVTYPTEEVVVEEHYYLIGTFNTWTQKDANYELTLDGTVYKKEVTFAKDVEFKINVGDWSSSWGKDNLGGKTYAELDGTNDGNLKMKEEKTFTVIFDPANNGTISFDGLTEKAPAVISYVLMGVNGDWTTGIPMTVNPDNADEYVLTDQVIIKATDAIKVVTLTDGQATAWCGDVDSWSNATYTADDRGNIVLEDGIYTFYFKKSTDNIYINQTGYARNVTNKYGTICLPYAAESTTGAIFYRVAGKETGKVYLESVDALEAGVPYIFEKSASQIKVVYTGEKETTAGSANGLVGTFADNTTVPNDAYILYGGAFCTNSDPADPNKINAYRAYLDLDEVKGGVPTQMPGRRYIGMSVQDENEATGVEDLFTTDAPVKVIENGQLIIIRDGVKYNVQGQKL